MFRLLGELAVAEDLKVDEAAADRNAPKQQHAAEKIESGGLAGLGLRGCHGTCRSSFSLALHFSSTPPLPSTALSSCAEYFDERSESRCVVEGPLVLQRPHRHTKEFSHLLLLAAS